MFFPSSMGIFLHLAEEIFPSPRMNFLHLADGELLGDFSLEVLEIEFDLAHVLLYVARGMEGLGRDDQFLLVVDGVEDDGEAGFLGNKVKTLLPVGIERTGALRGDADHKPVGLAGGLGETVGEGGTAVAPNGNAAQMAEEGTQGPEEPLTLHEEVAPDAFGARIEQADDEVPVAGMGGETDDAFRGEIGRDLFSPPHQAIEQKLTKIS